MIERRAESQIEAFDLLDWNLKYIVDVKTIKEFCCIGEFPNKNFINLVILPMLHQESEIIERHA